MAKSKAEQTADLAEKWLFAKQAEDLAKQQRVAIEELIVSSFEGSLPAKGTTYFDGHIKIVTGSTSSWNQEQLRAIKKEWPKDGPDWPFVADWKPQGDQIAYISEHEKKAYAALKKALTVKPKKPAFSDKNAKNGKDEE